MNLRRFIGKCKKGLEVIRLQAKPSYAQAGEDMIIDYLFNSLGIQKPSYLDIGANQPVLCNNTYFFYRKGCTGVCVEPDPSLFSIIKKKRPHDIILNIGIGLNNDLSAVFYLFPGHLNTWSTFSEEEAVSRENETGIKYKKIKVQLKTINSIVEEYFNPYPNFISIDVEGLDLDILRSLDFEKFKPEVICAETLSFGTTSTEKKLHDIIDFMHSKGYISYADTHINTIFCRKDLFNER